MADPRSILFVPDANTDDPKSQVSGSVSKIAEVDIVVAGNGGIIKDRHGDAAEVLTRLRAGLAAHELRHPTFDAGAVREADLLGVPLGEIEAVTIDGAHWFEVFGIQRSSPFGGPVLRFRIAQAPGGKKARFGISQGDTIAVREDAVRGVQRKGGEPLALQPLCKCGHRYDHHSHQSFSTRCNHDECDCGEYRPEAGS